MLPSYCQSLFPNAVSVSCLLSCKIGLEKKEKVRKILAYIIISIVTTLIWTIPRCKYITLWPVLMAWHCRLHISTHERILLFEISLIKISERRWDLLMMQIRVHGLAVSCYWTASTQEFNPRQREIFPSFKLLKPKPGILEQHMTQALTHQTVLHV